MWKILNLSGLRHAYYEWKELELQLAQWKELELQPTDEHSHSSGPTANESS